MPNVYGYRRVSTQKQAEQGGSLDGQEQQIKDYFEYRLKNQGYIFTGMFTDTAQSGSTSMLKRPSGAKLSAILQPGDAVVINRLDRGFRNLKDLLNTIDNWKTINVSLHLLDISVDTSTDIGRLILSVIGAVAEFERNVREERIKIASEALRKKGYLGRGSQLRYGFMIVGTRGHKKFKPNPYQRRIGAEIVRLRDVERWSGDAVWLFFARTRKWWYHGKRISHGCVISWYAKEKAMQAREKAVRDEREQHLSNQQNDLHGNHAPIVPPPTPQKTEPTSSENAPTIEPPCTNPVQTQKSDEFSI